MTKVKICGLTRSADIEAVNQARPDYVGFVFAKSIRQIGPAQAAVLKSLLDETIESVGVFVDAPLELPVSLYAAGTIDIAQLHGDEDEAYIMALKEKCDIPIIKAVKVRVPSVKAQGDSAVRTPRMGISGNRANEGSGVENPDKGFAAMDLADYLLLDSGGGSGLPFDWSLIDATRMAGKRWFLAGGLDIGNLPDALRVNPWGVDVSSGVETGGVKDYEKIQAFVRSVRLAQGVGAESVPIRGPIPTPMKMDVGKTVSKRTTGITDKTTDERGVNR